MISVLAVQWDLLPETSHRYTSETSASSSPPRCSLSAQPPPPPPLPFRSSPRRSFSLSPEETKTAAAAAAFLFCSLPPSLSLTLHWLHCSRLVRFGVSLSERALCARCNCCFSFSLPSKCSDRIDAEDGKVSM